MKKIYALILTVVMLLSSFTAVHADTSVSFTVDGLNMQWDTYIQNDRTFVSADKLSEVLGVKLTVSDSKITFADFEDTVEMTVGSKEALVNGEKASNDASPEIKDGTLMVPVRFVAESFGCNVEWDGVKSAVAVTDAGYANEKGLLIERPETIGQYNALRRAADLTDFTYKPLKDIPIRITSKEQGVLEAGKEYIGFPYSGVEPHEKFIGTNVSLETFVSALENPDSVLYGKDLYYWTGVKDTYYGFVCNGLVRYAYDIKARYATQIFRDIPGLRVIGEKGEFTVDDLKLADAMHSFNDGTSHTMMVSGIFRDPATGKIAEVEISHATRPRCCRKVLKAEEFCATYWKYALLRYDYLDEVSYDEEVHKMLFERNIDSALPAISIDYGNKSNYLVGEPTVVSVFRDGASTVEILKDDAVIETVSLENPGKFERSFDRGYYKVKIKETGDYAEFAVCQAEVTDVIDENGVITVTASSCDEKSELTFMTIRDPNGWIKCYEMNDEEKATGIIKREYPQVANGYKIHFENEYGVWCYMTEGCDYGCYLCKNGKECDIHKTAEK